MLHVPTAETKQKNGPQSPVRRPEHTPAPVTVLPRPVVRPSQAGALLQRKCACGGAPGPTGECAACRAERESALQRKAIARSEPAYAPPIVHDVLRSAGQPLDAATRALMEARFG